MTAKQISVTGVVQGVGFRPFVYGLAARFGLRGWVCNTSAGVEIVIEGEDGSLKSFVDALSAETPPLARIERLSVRDAAGDHFIGFEIRESESIQGAFQPISADIALCPDCERELFDPRDRRYLYPFINCTNCGPRFTIIKDIPYDRPHTTMAGFRLCPACDAEYRNPLDRRFHAQPVACGECGPSVWLARDGQTRLAGDREAILQTRRWLNRGRIVAVKGLGGFHLACDAANEAAVQELRRRKGRAGKPFAVMATDLATVEQICFMDEGERQLLTGHEKPILLLQRRANLRLADAIYPGVDTLGVMLPYTPLHQLLLNQSDPVLGAEPAPPVLVMTSGNLSEEPIATDNQEALEHLAPLADAFLLHDREINIRCDDSVIRVDAKARQDNRRRIPAIYLRRSRGYAPYPVRLPFEARPMLAVGGELKNTFCLTRDRYAFLSHYIGDMENAETYAAFEQGVDHLSRLFRIQIELIAHDLHPGYFTTAYARRAVNVARVGVQHHHAHIASCMADNGLENRKVIGLSFDGTGYGTDGAIWGGEVLVADYAGFERAAHLEYLPLPGGEAAIHHPWRIAVGYAAALGLETEGLPFLHGVDRRAVRIVQQQVERKLNAPPTSSLGRLFDAVASMAGVRSDVSYEAQAAIELEAASRPHLAAAETYPIELEKNGTIHMVLLKGLLEAVIRDVRRGEPAGRIGARFHRTMATMAVDLCRRIRDTTGLVEVALSGGVWQNQVLLDLTRQGLLEQDFTVYFHRQTPTNDGGIALGQAAVAAHR